VVRVLKGLYIVRQVATAYRLSKKYCIKFVHIFGEQSSVSDTFKNMLT